MAILDKKLLISDLDAVIGDYAPANMAHRISADLAEILTNYEVTRVVPDGGGSGDTESLQLMELFLDAKKIEGKSRRRLSFTSIRSPACMRRCRYPSGT